MARIVAALGLLVLAATAAHGAFIFDAARCNTNFDTPNNWGVNPWNQSTVPAVVGFGAGNGQPFRSVNVNVRPGTYDMGILRLEDNMVMSLAADGAVLSFNENAQGPAAMFTAGQAETPECDIGCHANYKVGSMEDAQSADYTALNLTTATRTPCNQDDVVIPRGYSTMIFAYGFTAFSSFTITGPSGSQRRITSQAMLPQLTFFPSSPNIRFGNAAIDYCSQRGRLATLPSGRVDSLQCMCTSACLADASNASDFLDTLYDQARSMRNAATMQATDSARSSNASASEIGLTYTFNDLVSRNIPWDTSVIATGAFPDTLGVEIQQKLPNGVSLIGLPQVTFTAPGTVVIQFRLLAPAWFRRGVVTQLTLTPFSGLTTSPANNIALLSFAAFTDSLVSANSLTRGNRALWRTASGYSQQVFNIWVGSNLPQTYLPRLVADSAKAAFSVAMVSALNGKYGVYDMSQNVLHAGLDLWPEDRIAFVRAGGSDVATTYVPSGAANYGLATDLVRCHISCWMFGSFQYGGWSDGGLTRAGDAGAALFEPPATGHPCQSLDLTLAEHNSCVQDAVSTAIEEWTAENFNGDEFGALTASQRAQYNDQIRVITLNVYHEIYGPCGPLGNVTAADGNTTSLCVDPNWDAHLTAHSNSVGGSLFAEQQAAAASQSYANYLASTTAADVAASSESSSSGGGGMIIIIGAAVGGLLVLLVLFFACKGGKKADNGSRDGLAFENPLYDNTTPSGATGTMDMHGGLYDEPELQTANPMFDEEENLQGGYLDVQPDDEDDDEDDSEDDE